MAEGRKAVHLFSKKKSEPMLAKIGRLSLAWCQVEPRFGGYVSENWLAYARISKYIHQLLNNLERNDEVYSDPEGLPMGAYNLKQRKAWLLARKIDGVNKKSLKAVVDEKFNQYLIMPEGTVVLPGIVVEVVSKASLAEVSNMVVCWHVCISRVMSLDR